MKKLKTNLFTSMIVVFVLFTSNVNAQEPKTAEISIKVSSICGKCKVTLESNLVFEKGIKKSELDVKNATIKVVYNPNKTSPEKIRLAISKLGYDADDVIADEKAYNKLSSCCKKGTPIHE